MQEKWGDQREPRKFLTPPSELSKTIEFSVHGQVKNPEFLHEKYVVEKLSIAEIARLTSSSESTVLKYLRKAGVKSRGVAGKSKSRLAYGEAWRHKQVVPHKAELATIERINSLRSQGFSYWKIAEILNSMKVPTKTRRGKWHARYVQKILAGSKQ